jgi:CheY-like chemotaxis protein
MGIPRAVRNSEDISLSEVMSRDVICVGPDLTIDALVSRFSQACIDHAPVCDGGGRCLGVVSLADCAAIAGGLAVADIMMPFVFALPAHASLARAAALMAVEGIHRVVVVDADGCFVGVVSSIDVMRWVARAAGYLARDEDLVALARREVLVVDDDDDLREQLAELLGAAGYEVVTARDGREALERLHRGDRPGVILLDLGMPIMDGRALTTELKKDLRTRGIPVVLLSGLGNAREEAARLAADDCLVKPVPFPTLLGTVQKFCSA